MTTDKDKEIEELKQTLEQRDQTIEQRDQTIEQQDQTIKTQKTRNKKLRAKLNPKESFVCKNKERFADLIKLLKCFKEGEKSRYFFTRKTRKDEGTEEVFKTNVFVRDLIEYKARSNVKDDFVNSRISMDIHSLITCLSKGRIERKGKEKSEGKPAPKAKPKAKAKAKPEPKAKESPTDASEATAKPEPPEWRNKPFQG